MFSLHYRFEYLFRVSQLELLLESQIILTQIIEALGLRIRLEECIIGLCGISGHLI